MRDRSRLTVLSFLLLSLSLAGCESTDEFPEEGSFPQTKVGELYLDGKVVLVSIDPPVGGKEGSFVVRNASDEDQDDLQAVILLYTPAAAGKVQAHETEVQDLRFTVYRGEEYPIPVKETRKDVRGWKLDIRRAPTVAREGATPGTLFLKGKIECVEIVKRLTHSPPSISFTVESRSDSPLRLLQYRVELVKSDTVVWTSKWISFKDLLPGQSREIGSDLQLPDVGSAEAVLKIRQMVL